MKFRSKLAEGGPGSGVPGHKPGDPVPKSSEDIHASAIGHHQKQASKAEKNGDFEGAAAHDEAANAHFAALHAHRSGSADAEQLSKEAHIASADAKSRTSGTPPKGWHPK